LYVGLVLLGENLAKSLVQRQSVAPEPTVIEDLTAKQDTILQLLEVNQKQIGAHIESANAVNAALLSFLSKSQ
jgi:hypothetical protein